MKTSNTKLLAHEKEYLKDLRETQKDVKIVTDGKTTIAYREFKNTVEFSLSVSCDTEKKFRAKVGEYHARRRLDDFESVKMDNTDFFTMLDFVYYTQA